VYNDNLLLTPLPHDETYGYWVSPAAEFSGKTERLDVLGRVAADFVTYYGGEETQFTNIFLPLTINYKGETDLLGLSFSRLVWFSDSLNVTSGTLPRRGPGV
jgi:hypothetical protein